MECVNNIRHTVNSHLLACSFVFASNLTALEFGGFFVLFCFLAVSV